MTEKEPTCWICHRTYDEIKNEPYLIHGGFPRNAKEYWSNHPEFHRLEKKKYWICPICDCLLMTRTSWKDPYWWNEGLEEDCAKALMNTVLDRLSIEIVPKHKSKL